jgi:hypothetical protein
MVLMIENQLVRTSKPTGSANCPPEVERAHAIEHMIGNRVTSGVVWDEDLNDEVIEISSDEHVPIKKEPATYIARHVAQDPLNEGQSRTITSQLRGTLHNVARAFDPVTQAAREEGRQAHRLQAMQVQNLASQL